MGRKAVSVKPGDVVSIPSPYGVYYFAQVFDQVSELGVVAFIFLDLCLDSPADAEQPKIEACRVIGSSLVTPELVRNGSWPILGNFPLRESMFPEKLQRLKESAFVGAIIEGAGLTVDYLDTFYGFKELSSWPDPSFVLQFFSVELVTRSQDLP